MRDQKNKFGGWLTHSQEEKTYLQTVNQNLLAAGCINITRTGDMWRMNNFSLI